MNSRTPPFVGWRELVSLQQGLQREAIWVGIPRMAVYDCMHLIRASWPMIFHYFSFYFPCIINHFGPFSLICTRKTRHPYPRALHRMGLRNKYGSCPRGVLLVADLRSSKGASQEGMERSNSQLQPRKPFGSSALWLPYLMGDADTEFLYCTISL